MHLIGLASATALAVFLASGGSHPAFPATQSTDGMASAMNFQNLVQPVAGDAPRNNLKPGVTRSRGVSIDVDRLAEALKRGALTSASLKNWITGTVKIVELSQLDEQDRAKLETVLRENGPAAERVRATIAENQRLADELQKNDVEPAAVIAAGVQADGTVVVYTR